MEQTMDYLMQKHSLIVQKIDLNPWQVIPLKNEKKAKETKEVHLGNRNGTSLTHFEHFTNLQTLWVNGNKLTSLVGLSANFRIKHLYAQHNHINTLEEVFVNMKHIEILVLYDNQLRDLQKNLRHLQKLKNLTHLELYDNPAAQEPNYKVRVLYELPKLQIIDRHKVTQQQIQGAVIFMTNAKKNKKWL